MGQGKFSDIFSLKKKKEPSRDYALVLDKVSKTIILEKVLSMISAIFPVDREEANAIVKSAPIILVDNIREEVASFIAQQFKTVSVDLVKINDMDVKKKIGVKVDFEQEQIDWDTWYDEHKNKPVVKKSTEIVTPPLSKFSGPKYLPGVSEKVVYEGYSASSGADKDIMAAVFQENNQLKSELKEAQAKLVSASKSREDLESSRIEELSKQNKQLEETLKDTQSKLSALVSFEEDLKNILEEKEDALAVLKREHAAEVMRLKQAIKDRDTKEFQGHTDAAAGTLQKEIESIRKECDELKQAKSLLEKEKEKTAQNAAQLKEKLQEQSMEKEQLAAFRAGAEKELSELRSRLEKAVQSIEHLSAQKASAEKELGEHKDTASKTDKTIQQEIKQARKKMEEDQARIAELEKEIEKTVQSAAQLKERLQEQSMEKEQLAVFRAGAEKELSELRIRLEKAAQSIEHLSAQKEALEKDILSARHDLDNVVENKKSADAQFDRDRKGFEAAMEAMEKDRGRLNETLQSLENRLRDESQKNIKAQETIDQMREQIAVLENAKKHAQDDAARLCSAEAKSKERIEALEKERNTLHKQISTLGSQADDLNRQANELTSKLQHSQNSAERLVSEKQGLETRLSEAVQTTSEINRQLKAEKERVFQLLEEKEELQGSLNKEKDKINKLISENEQLWQKVQGLEESVKIHSDTGAKLKEELTQSKDINSYMRDKVMSLENKLTALRLEKEEIDKKFAELQDYTQKEISGLNIVNKERQQKISELNERVNEMIRDAQRLNKLIEEKDSLATGLKIDLYNEKEKLAATQDRLILQEKRFISDNEDLKKELTGKVYNARYELRDFLLNRKETIEKLRLRKEKNKNLITIKTDELDSEIIKMDTEYKNLEKQLSLLENEKDMNIVLKEHQKIGILTSQENIKTVLLEKKHLKTELISKKDDVLSDLLDLDIETKEIEKKVLAITEDMARMKDIAQKEKVTAPSVKFENMYQQPAAPVERQREEAPRDVVRHEPVQEKTPEVKKPAPIQQPEASKPDSSQNTMAFKTVAQEPSVSTTEEAAAMPKKISALQGFFSKKFSAKKEEEPVKEPLQSLVKELPKNKEKEPEKPQPVSPAAPAHDAAVQAEKQELSAELQKYQQKLRSYSQTQLEDIYNHINPDKYPDKYKLVVQELENRKNKG